MIRRHPRRPNGSHVACFGDVPSGSYMSKGVPDKLPTQVNDAAIRSQVVTLLEKLAN